jgi:hypothetical protein
MLVLFNSHKKQIHTFKTYDALFHHLENMEKVKKMPKRIFAHHSRQRVMSFYRYVRNRKLAPYAIAFEQGLEQALRHAAGTARDEAQKYGLDILESVSGDVQHPRLVPLTPDVEAFSKNRQGGTHDQAAH